MERGLQQGRRHLHGRSHPHQHQLPHPRGGPGGGLQRHQRAKAVADQHRLRQTGGVEQRQHEVGGGLYRDRRLTSAAAVARQVNGQHIPAMVRQVARLQNPDAVVVQHPVNEDDAGLGGIEGLTAGVAVGRVAVDGEEHGVRLGSRVQ